MKRTHVLPTLLLSASAALLISGCSYNQATPDQKMISGLKSEIRNPNHFVSSYLGGKVRDNWLRTFHDPTLNKLVIEAQKNNPDIRLAAGRIEQAAAIMRLTQANAIPQLNLQGNYSIRSWKAQNHYDRGNIAAVASWEPDLWGRLANQTLREKELTLAQVAEYEWARQSLSANTAKAWFLLESDRMIYDFAKEVVKIQAQAESIFSKRAEIGEGNQRDVHMLRGMLAEAKENETTALSAKENDTRALETLIGRYPANAIRSHRLSKVPSAIPAGVPADLLNRRPDVIAAQDRVAAAFHNKEATKLLRLPRITLGVQIGFDVLRDTMSKLISGLFMPIADAGTIQAQIDAASAEQKMAIEQYRSTVLNAFREVENYLAFEKQLAKRFNYLDTMVKEYKTTYDMTDANYKIGQGTLIDVLTVQAKWIQARILKVQVHKERLVNRVNLHLALGGSFDNRR